ncbi:hypothetical protein J132_07786 [Termitomyces sp. J132]|nr:hypothetical protein J132_07786 [Termitomyces sp. J132]
MERKEIVERKLSKKLNAGTSIWSRKSVKRSATAHPAPSPAQVSHQPHQSHDAKRREEEELVATDSDKPDWVLPMNSPRSIIPDSRDLPVSHSKDVWSSVPIPSHKTRYFIHNPIGPRWYKNHHLIPRSETTPAARPPSFFSPSFPPIAASASQDRLEDPTHAAGPSRTPSNSPLPTPNSSQTRVEDRPRTRKLSETAHDVVDLLDVTDPWGTNWHHHSPYDIGLVNGPISADVQDILQTRSRRSSMDQSRRKSVAPSPLSQSMSAINLNVKPEIQIPRKLSKRRAPTPTSATVGAKDTGRHAVSLPTTPLDTRLPSSDLPKRMSVAAPLTGSSMSTQNMSSKKGTKGGVLGRLVRKLSLLAKPLSNPIQLKREVDRQQINSLHHVPDAAPRHSLAPSRQTLPEKPMSETGKRVPPPPAKEPVKVDDISKDTDSFSVVSFEAPFSIGRLTIANPDSPELDDTTPVQGALPLPPNKESLGTALRNESPPHSTSPSTFASTLQLNLDPPVPPQKSLSPPTPPTKLNDEVVSESPSIIVRQPSSEHQRTDLLSQKSELSERPSSTLSNKSPASFQGSGSATEQSSSSSRPTAPPPQNIPQPVDQPSSQPLQMLRPASSTSKKAESISVAASTVPFPTGNPGERLHLFYEYDNSLLSAASVLANPPTPHTDADKAILATPNQPPPVLPSKTDLPTRQTQTFRLVRSPSENVFSNDKIVAAGEQWEVVGTEKKGKGSSSSKEHSAKEPELKSQERHHRDRDAKDRRDRDYHRKSRDHDCGRDSRDKCHGHNSRDTDHVRHSKDRDRFKDRDHVRHSKDRDRARHSKDRDRVRHSKDRDYAPELEGHDRDYVSDYKGRDSRGRNQKDRVSTTHSEKKRDSKARVEAEAEADSRHRHRSRRSSKLDESERSITISKSLSPPVLEPDSRHPEPSAVQHDLKRSDRPQEDRERKPTRKRHEASPTTVNLSTAQILPLPTQDIPVSRPLGRHPSLSTRPTSQLPPADEINAVRAKEAWDMERLWKARSVQGDELDGYTTIPSNHNTPVMTNISPPVVTSLHGSSHTSFVQQKPQHSIYHSMPAAPPPIIYPSPLSIPTVAHQIPTVSRRQPHTRTYNESVASDQKSYTRKSNPLPELPRESPYEIPADARNSEYWTKYAGLAATH